MKMKGRWKIIVIFLSLTVKVECDIFDELLVSVKNLHDKIDKIDLEQTKTHEKVDQLQNDFNNLRIDCNENFSTTSSSLTSLNKEILKIEEKMERTKDVDLEELHEVSNKTVQHLQNHINSFSSEISSKFESSCTQGSKVENFCNENFSLTSSKIADLKNEIQKMNKNFNNANEAFIQEPSLLEIASTTTTTTTTT